MHYFRVSFYMSTPKVYTFRVSVNNVLMNTYNDIIYPDNTKTIRQLTIINACQIQLTYDGPVKNIYLYPPN